LKNKIFLTNILSLGALQFINYIFPLIAFLYLIRVLGVEKFGLINFAIAFVGYFSLIVDYGFNLSSVREIAIVKNDNQKLSSLISTVYSVKIFLLLISFLIFSIIIYSINFFNNELLLYWISFAIVLNTAISPQIIYQGIQDTKYIAVISLMIKIIWIVVMLFIVKSSDDYLIAVALNCAHLLIISITSLYVLKSKYRINLVLPVKYEFIRQLKESGLIFLSTCSISIYTISNTFLLGVFASNIEVGYFTGADKIRQAVQNLIYPFTAAGFPHAADLFSKSIDIGKKFISKSFFKIGSFSFLISVILFLFSSQLVELILGDGFEKSVTILRIISFLPFVIFLSNLFGIQTMLNISLQKIFTIIIVVASLISLGLTILLVPVYKEIGTSISMLITEILVTLSIVFYLLRQGYFK